MHLYWLKRFYNLKVHSSWHINAINDAENKLTN